MRYFTLGRTGLSVSRTGFGALPIQRVSFEEASALLNRALDGGINYIDTARVYSDSEEKIGRAIAHRRGEYYIATKSMSSTAEGFNRDLETSLRMLGTDHIDVYQFHNPGFVPVPGGADGLYDAAVKAREAGKIRFIGITNHSLDRAFEAAESGLYDTLQYPFNHLATDREIALVRRCGEKNVGFVCMKAMSGGLITNAKLAFAWLDRFDNVVPIWGVQRMGELEEFLSYAGNPPALDEALSAQLEADRRELVGAFCRGCGYCMPCPAGIPINNANRMKQLLERSPWAGYLSEKWQADMAKIEDCIHCGKCAAHCPYGLKPYETLPAHLAFYRAFVKAHAGE